MDNTLICQLSGSNGEDEMDEDMMANDLAMSGEDDEDEEEDEDDDQFMQMSKLLFRWLYRCIDLLFNINIFKIF